jgi:mono/diheme cytochrome c family protein
VNDRMNKTVAAAVPALLFAGALQLARPVLAADPPQTAGATAARVERGAYLVRLGSCNDCHTPWKMGAGGPEPDMTRMLSGHPQSNVMPPPPALGDGAWGWAGSADMTAFSGPWGVSFAANLTPDGETGLGNWTEDTFIRTIRSGRHEGIGRPLLPPMPWPNIAGATDEDLKAIWAFLRTLPPVVNRVPQPIDPPEARR